MADKRCENGHFIDESWDICPYCPQPEVEAEIPIVARRRDVDDVRPRDVDDIRPRDVDDIRPRDIEAIRPRAVDDLRPRAVESVPPPPTRSRPIGDVRLPDGNAGPKPAPAPRISTTPGVAALALSSSPFVERTVASPRAEGASQKRHVVAWLVGLNGSVRGESYPLRIGRNVIGRDRRSDVVVNDDQASSHHADLVFRPEERRFILMDHNSTNGTYVNEAEIEPRRDLGGKEIIRIGSHRFIFIPLCHEGFHWDDEGLLQ